MTDRKIWGQPGLESSLPHIIVDAEGRQMLPRIGPPYKNRAVATRLLNQLQRQHNPALLGNPKLWRVAPVEADK